MFFASYLIVSLSLCAPHNRLLRPDNDQSPRDMLDPDWPKVIFINTSDANSSKDIQLPKFVNFINGSLSFSYSGSWVCPEKSCTGILDYQNTYPLEKSDNESVQQHGNAFIDIIDSTWNTSFYQESLFNFTHNKTTVTTDPTNSSAFYLPSNLTRNISALISLVDGIFTNNKARMAEFTGVYSPVTQRGMAKGVLLGLFSITDANEYANASELLHFESLVNNSAAPFPPPEYYGSFSPNSTDIVAKGDASVCTVYFFFTMNYSQRKNSPLYYYLPDQAISWYPKDYFYIENKAGNMYARTGSPPDSESLPSVFIPLSSARVFSPDCRINTTINAPVACDSPEILTFSVFTALYSVLGIVNIIFTVQQVTRLMNTDHIRRLSIIVLYMRAAASLNLFMAVFMFIFVFTRILRLPLLLATVVSIGNVFPDFRLFIHAILLRYCNVAQLRSWRTIGILLGSAMGICMTMFVLIAIVLMLPIACTYVYIGLLLSYWFINIVLVFRNNSVHTPYTFRFILINSITNFGIAIYFLGYEKNFMNIEASMGFMIAMGIVFFLQLLLSLLQNRFGPRFGLSCFYRLDASGKLANAYHYNERLLSEKALHCIESVVPLSDSYVQSLLPLVSGDESSARIEDALHYLREKGAKASSPIVILPFDPLVADASSMKDSSAMANVDKKVADEVPLVNKSVYCMNPLHKHSVFFDRTLSLPTFLQLFPEIKERVPQSLIDSWLSSWTEEFSEREATDCASVEPSTADVHSTFKDRRRRHQKLRNVLFTDEVTNCFYVGIEDDISRGMYCSICLDFIKLSIAENAELMGVFCQVAKNFKGRSYTNAHLASANSLYEGEQRYFKDHWDLPSSKNAPRITRQLWQTPCGHTFHGGCLLSWMSNYQTCPIDREPLPELNAFV